MHPYLSISGDKTVLFVSDLHIDSSGREETEKVKQVIETVNPDFIFIAGDLFNIAFGWMRSAVYDNFGFINYLEKWSKSGERKVIWLEGNHEFGLKYLKGTINVVEKELILKLGSRKIYLAHGDLIDRNDIKYQIFRFLTKNRLSIFAARLIPYKLLFMLASVIDKNLTADYTDLPERTREFAKDYFKKGFDLVILGHTHKADICREDKHCYYNIGNFMEHKDYLVYKNGKFSADRYI